MKLIVGLGNPGSKYNGTRHNVGFDVVDSLARQLAPGEPATTKFDAVVIETRHEGEKVLLMKPQKFMNRSGQAIQQALHTTISTRQSRKGEISSWKAYAPAHAGKLAIEAVDRVMRGEGAPSPIYEGEDSVIARILDGKKALYKVPLP